MEMKTQRNVDDNLEVRNALVSYYRMFVMTSIMLCACLYSEICLIFFCSCIYRFYNRLANNRIYVLLRVLLTYAILATRHIDAFMLLVVNLHSFIIIWA